MPSFLNHERVGTSWPQLSVARDKSRLRTFSAVNKRECKVGGYGGTHHHDQTSIGEKLRRTIFERIRLLCRWYPFDVWDGRRGSRIWHCSDRARESGIFSTSGA